MRQRTNKDGEGTGGLLVSEEKLRLQAEIIKYRDDGAARTRVLRDKLTIYLWMAGEVPNKFFWAERAL
jgi:hypothetical protein